MSDLEYTAKSLMVGRETSIQTKNKNTPNDMSYLEYIIKSDGQMFKKHLNN